MLQYDILGQSLYHVITIQVKSSSTHTLTDRMESYFLAETTKYLYLLFDHDNFLNQPTVNQPFMEHLHYDAQLLRSGCSLGTSGYIMNTEAHPMDIAAIQCCTSTDSSLMHTCNKTSFHSKFDTITT